MKMEIDKKNARLEFPAFPVVLVTVEENIIAIGLVHIFSFTPLKIGIGMHPKRYSYRLLEKIKDFGVNIPTKELVEKVDLCGTLSGRDVDKFKESGFTKMNAQLIWNAIKFKKLPSVVRMTGLWGRLWQLTGMRLMTGKKALVTGIRSTG